MPKTMPETVTKQRLKGLFDAYGASIHRWPKDERKQALELLDESPELESLLREAAELDALLDLATAPEVSDAFMADILAAAEMPAWRQWCGYIWPFGPFWQPALGLTAAAAIGAALGLFMTTPAEIALITHEIEGLILG